MKSVFAQDCLILPFLLLLALPAVGQAQFTYWSDGVAIHIVKYTGPGGDVTIPSTINGLPVTSIGDSAFSNTSSLTNITIPDTVTSIGDGAFESCASLNGVTIPDSVTSIGTRAFAACRRLTAITVGALNSAYSSVSGVLFNQGQTLLIQYPAAKSGSDYTVPNSVTNIGNDAFLGCWKLAGVTIPKNVTRIGDSAFRGCTNLATILIANSVTSIGDSAFVACSSLASIAIPNSVVSIGASAFYYCTSLTAITVDALNPAYSSVSGVLFDHTQTLLIQYPAGRSGSDYMIPGNATSIGVNAFSRSSKLTSVTIPDGITNIGDSAFGNCSNLTKITIGNSVQNIGNYAFWGCISLTSVTIPNSVNSVGDWTFYYCTSLTSVMVGNTVTNIGVYAFTACGDLTGVYFEGNAPSVDSSLFDSADNAISYYLPGTTGWGPTFGGRPTALWSLPNPLILSNSSTFGVRTNAFGFIISWATNIPVVVEASTNLTTPNWSPVATNTLTDGWSYFSDPDWANQPRRFYRIRSP